VLRRALGSVLGAAAAARAGAYGRGFLRPARLRGPVISVGNLGLGGRGKTPVTALIAGWLREAGAPVAVLSRGYRGAFHGDALVVSDGERVLADARTAGDEPVLLARQLPGVVVAVGSRRDVVGRAVEDRFGPRVHVLDDGFQHLRLHRDLDVLCLDVRDLRDHPLPAGTLREWPSAHARAGAILLSGPEPEDTAALERARASLGPHRTHLLRRRVTGLTVGDGQAAAWPPRVFLLAAIARPERFGHDAQGRGAAVVGHRFFRDHHGFSDADLAAVTAQARSAGADAIVTTAKDAVRLEGRRVDLPLLVLRIAAEVAEEERLRARVLALAAGARP
jgi:tetraacyldisaccharide 4'-kinase